MNRVGQRRVRLTFTRYTAASAVATTITQIVLLAFSLQGTVPAAAASTVAFAAGAVPQFLIIRRWAFGRLPRQIVTFVAITGITGLASVSMVAMVDVLVGPAIVDKGLRALTLSAGYLLGGAPIFLAKFLVLDRVFFVRPPRLQVLSDARDIQNEQAEEGPGRVDWRVVPTAQAGQRAVRGSRLAG
jgi:putative flippase GtrA